MRKKKVAVDFRLQPSDATDAQRMAAIVTLGMCFALQSYGTTPRYACGVLFRPSLVSSLRALGADPVLCEALDKALELEDVARIAPEGLKELLEEVAKAMLHYLRTSDWSKDDEGNWT